MPRIHELERLQVVPRSRAEVFDFFADPANLNSITPDFLEFRFASALPARIAAGTVLDYRLRLFGVRFRWRTRIEALEPGRSFVDVQVDGPYARWEHEHLFDDVEGGTLFTDRVRYVLPFAPFGELAEPLFVRRTLERVFDHRRERVAALLDPAARAVGPPPRARAVAGAA